MKQVKYIESWFEVGPSAVSYKKFAAGQCYPVTDETAGHVDRGIAEYVQDEPELKPAKTTKGK